MLKNPQDKPILSERSQTFHRDRIESNFARTFGTALIVKGRAMDLGTLKFALQNAIARQIWMLWRRGIELGNGDAERELELIGWKGGGRSKEYGVRSKEFGTSTIEDPATDGRKHSTAKNLRNPQPTRHSLLHTPYSEREKDRANFALRLENLPARQAIFDRINLLSGNVADTEFDRIRDALGENIQGDISRNELVAAISEVLGGDRFTARSRTIARTELTAAYNTGRVQTYRENSIQAVRRYCLRDERKCEQCADLNGKVARLDSGDLDRLTPPSHPNCRCVVSPIVDMRQLIEAGRKLKSDVKSGWEIAAITNS
jgi:SPP1 gp7 family putative phage head morphogenesis protein